MENSQTEKKPSNTREWRMWKEERKAEKREHEEKRLLKKLEKDHKKKLKMAEMTTEETEDNKSSGREYTVSIALPGSIMNVAQSPELKTYLAGQIARAAVVFNVDEIIVFDETGEKIEEMNATESGDGYGNIQLAHLLQYLECPQYLRRKFFPIHKNLQQVGVLNPLDCPSHVKEGEESLYREGVVLEKPSKGGRGSFVNVGLKNEVQVDKVVTAGARVTVELRKSSETSKKLKGKLVDQSTPVEKHGIYWGYSVRLAARLSDVFSKGPYSYDLTIGTSEKGETVNDFKIPQFKHLLIVFGGVKGLEYSLDNDDIATAQDPAALFQYYINTCPDQGSRTIRTEEAIPITLSCLRSQIQQNIPPP